MNKSSKKSTVALLVSAAILLFIQTTLFFLLIVEPSFYHGYVNVRPVYGFWANSFGAMLLLGGSLMALRRIAVRRSRSHSEVLDNDFGIE